MKIFLAFLQSDVQHAIPAYNFWQYYIKNGIEEAGHEWLECPGTDWAAGLIPKSQTEQAAWKAEIWDKTINWLRANPADLFLSYLYPEQIDTAAINEIKCMGIPCINFYCDNVRQFTVAPKEFAVFSLNWVPEYKALKMYKKAGYAYVNAPMPIWVEPDRRKIHAEANRQITFIGSKDIQRALFFEKVIAQDPALNLCIYGSGWKDGESPAAFAKSGGLTKIGNQYAFIKQHGIVPYLRKLRQRLGSNAGNNLHSRVHDLLDFETYNRLTAASMVTVGINRYPSYGFPLTLPDTYSRLRDIEAPMLGACYLTEYTEGLEYLYNIGEEIETYNTPDDFIEKVHQLENDQQRRQRLKLNGQKRALGEHTIPNTLNKLIQKL